MSRVLVLGAGGQIARWVVQVLATHRDVAQTLFVRNAGKLGAVPPGATVVAGDVLDAAALGRAMEGQDLVYANLTGTNLDLQARSIVAAMGAAGVKRLIFVLALGIHGEVPGRFGEWNEGAIGEELKPFRRAAALIEASGLDYTLLRPAWLTDEDEVDYELTARNEPFKGTVVSRRSVADLIARLVATPSLHVRESLGVYKPGTDGDKPFFM